jgi:serine protease Do
MRTLGQAVERLRRSTVQVRLGPRERGGGSGIVWSGDGLILTNAHVARSRSLEVELWDGTTIPASVAARDPRRDLASLRVETAGLTPAPVGDSGALRPGELVIAVGNPLGFAGALSTGTVHSVHNGWIRADVQLAPGNSGGPLANARGEVIGINTAIYGGLGLAVPSNTARDFLSHGARPSLGVTLRPSALGLHVLEIEKDSAADRASLRPGDTLLIHYDELHRALDSGHELLKLHFLRGDGRTVREAVVRLGARAEAAA